MLNNFWTEKALFFSYKDINTFKKNVLYFADNQYDKFIFLDGFQIPYIYQCFPTLIGFGVKNELNKNVGNAFDGLKSFCENKQNPILGFLNFELKNEIENLETTNIPTIEFPDLYFFEPETLLLFLPDGFYFYSEKFEIHDFIKIIENQNYTKDFYTNNTAKKTEKVNEEIYIKDIKYIQTKIQRGDVYEVNYCKETVVNDIALFPIDFFSELTSKSPMPFSSLVKFEDNYLICASPERFLKKIDTKLISQPIKGTSKRGKNAIEDADLVRELINSEKERAENMMIVDLVRNDLSHTAKDGSVFVEELCKVYTFETVHQMISTITSVQSKSFSFIDTIKHCFPMGSMTGAPKLSALKLISETEKSARGLFSGSVGYIMPNTDFDFNVVIRSVLYDKSNKIASYQAGSAITIDAIAENEYEECKTKLATITSLINRF